MKKTLLTGIAASALVFAGVGIEIPGRPADALLPIDLYANPGEGLCTSKAGALATRRAFFLSAASAYAATRPQDPLSATSLVGPETIELMQFYVTAASPEAEALFEAGLALAMGFNHEAALDVFMAAQEADPKCAMCAWGEAYVLGSDINAPIVPDQAGRAMEAAQRAVALASTATSREKALVVAMQKRFKKERDGTVTEQPAAFAEAMAAAAERFPDDRMIRTLAAESMMVTQPWDYWEADGSPKGMTAQAQELLESVLADYPDYPPAIHFYIHLTEASPEPELALAYADRLAEQPPELGHLVHMPTHTYYVLGQWRKSVEQNKLAIAADEAYIASHPVSDFYRYGYYPHNVHFALTSAQMGGDGALALAMADKLAAALPMEMAAVAPWIEVAEAAPYYAAVQFRAPAEILALPEPAGDGAYRKAAWHYARGEAYARQGRKEAALAEAAAIEGLMTAAGILSLDENFVPASPVLQISALTVKARALAASDLPQAIALMREAGEIEVQLPYNEPPWWYYPTGQTLGALLLQAGELDEAEMVFLETLAASPNNAWVLAGLHAVYEQKGDSASAERSEALFNAAWLGPDNARPDVTHL